MIYVFATSLDNANEYEKVKLQLQDISSVVRVNFDQEDEDKVLRVVAIDDVRQKVIKSLVNMGHYCIEMDW